MQLYALNGTTPIFASKAERGKNYFCPECGSAVRLRGGPSRQTHFYHIALPKQCRQHQKSEEHLQLQLKLCDLLGPEAQIECPFPAIHRIADVAWHSKNIVFEVQCSPLPLEEAEKRTLDYTAAGYQVVWILHDKQFNKVHLSAAEAHLRAVSCYTAVGLKRVFGPTRKLPRFNDRKRVNIRNMNPFEIVESRGFGAVQIPRFRPSAVYFTNVDKQGMGIVYDQFEVIAKNRRVFKGPPLPVSPIKLSLIPAIASPDIALPRQVLDRLMHWKYYAEGDLLQRLLKEGHLSHSAKQMVAIESRLNRPIKTARIRLKTLIAKSYGALLDSILSGQS